MSSIGHLNREDHLVELVNEEGQPLGSATVSDAHLSPGALHRAFSVFLTDDEGRVLLQQRAAAKTRFPLRWGNTCCGHPAPGEPVTVAAARRLTEELAVRDVTLTEIGVYTYRATDPVTGRVEHEYDHVLIGALPDGVVPHPDPAEIATLRWASLPGLRTGLTESPELYAPWLPGVFEILTERSGVLSTERSGGR
ncbi:isopentenyl-diphosphate delta-isomerase [Actinoplanes sp. SE50]|uniref:isopentenyl-diphosphate Delta-isomerase n=1 Tax=unclassified Actinoplanes TaxID=2626549 RepID=UPI00023ED35F|nr:MULTISPECIES: isopentenyl-diphosphate Delta-isomerase [unclassified Actinoplanes]AEV81152.1 isopentenyl-diphosphate delta-isomerase [Actinoplanes sp. SE50/110]ATO79553.1 isopentenyl-diphosphate delta-isomerase [Actinoplanes sp. SE50]SLL96954.1 isopentenyl-diphosphate Delta-isomerase [Actinoplanes sp. SE50/110]